MAMCILRRGRGGGLQLRGSVQERQRAGAHECRVPRPEPGGMGAGPQQAALRPWLLAACLTFRPGLACCLHGSRMDAIVMDAMVMDGETCSAAMFAGGSRARWRR